MVRRLSPSLVAFAFSQLLLASAAILDSPTEILSSYDFVIVGGEHRHVRLPEEALTVQQVEPQVLSSLVG